MNFRVSVVSTLLAALTLTLSVTLVSAATNAHQDRLHSSLEAKEGGLKPIKLLGDIFQMVNESKPKFANDGPEYLTLEQLPIKFA